MKFIHCADLHLDSKIDTLPSEKSKIRREEILRSFERMISFAVQNQVKAVIISGDMFDTSRVTIKTRARVLNAISKAQSVDFLYLTGNHDDESFVLSIEQLPNNLKLFSDNWTSFNYGNAVITGVNFTPLNKGMVYDTLNLDANGVNIVCLHGQVVGYNSSDKAETISIPKLKNKNIDYLALGHIHSFTQGEIDQRGKFTYCGCLDARGFDETGEKGFVLLEVDGKKVNGEFVSFSSRIFREIIFNVDGYTDYFTLKDDLLSGLNNECKSSDLVKIVLTGEHKTDLDIDFENLTSLLNEKYFFAKIYDKTQLKVELSDYEKDKSVRGEFVRLVWESDLGLEAKQKVIMCGINALKGEI